MPEETIADVAERLDRCADRYQNAGDEPGEAAAREAAEAVRKCDSLDMALRIERVFLLACGVLQEPAGTRKPRVGLSDVAGKPYVATISNVRAGGSRGWRNNNPGYIPCSDRAVYYGALGCDGMYAIFPDEYTGRGALGPWIRATYPDRTVHEVLRELLPADEIGLDVIDRLDKQGGIDPEMRTEDLDDAQCARLADALVADVSWLVGESYDSDSGTAPAWVESLWAQETASVAEVTSTEEAGTAEVVPSDNS